MTKDRFDIHQHITNQIITSIEQTASAKANAAASNRLARQPRED